MHMFGSYQKLQLVLCLLDRLLAETDEVVLLVYSIPELLVLSAQR